MHDSISSAFEQQQTPAVRLGGRHGYRIDGDLASINAELRYVGARGEAAPQQWALQLWACDEPYGGGSLSGVMVAEAPIALPGADEPARPLLDAVAFARPPASTRDYSMVLVLAGGRPGAFDQVHDFANYPARERFLGPHFEGSVGYRVSSAGKVALRAERVINPRAADNLSGSLALQLWLLAEPYRGGSFAGTLLASVAIGRAHGQSAIEPGEQEVALASAAEGGHAVLMLREWTAQGYLTRDYCNFAEPFARVAADVAAPEPGAAVAETVAEAAPAADPVEVAEAAAATATGAVADAAQAQAGAANTCLSLNRASADELARAVGISKKLAAEVIRARPFKSFAELTRVRGIGEKTVRKFRAAMSL